MNRTSIVTAGILLGVCCALPTAAGAEASNGAGTIEHYQQAISGAKDKKEEAVLRKKLGDQYAAQEDYPQAAASYLTALALAPSAFTLQERLQMAIAISWADRLDDAEAVLRSILAEDPNDRDARIHLAKVLSWSEKPQEAEAEADWVLSRHTEDRDALLVKANVMRWRGDARASIPVYEKALAQGENFDARIGLAYAYLDAGEKGTAKEISAPLKPAYPYQEKELARFSDALCTVQARHLSVPYSYYYDSDKNSVNRVALLYGFGAGRWDTELAYRLTDAKDPVRHEHAEDIGITAHAKVGRFDTGAGMGISMTGGGNLVTGHAGADTDTAWGAIGASASREMLTDTAQLIENRITRTSGTLGLSETVSPRLSFFERFIYSGYSDGNNSEDLRLGAKYAVTLSLPKIAAGYRFRYLDFRRQSGSGYFDPEDFTSHQVYASLYAEKDGYYANLEPSVGYQSYTRYGGRVSDTFYSLFAAAGWTMKKCTAFEIYVEGGNYAGGAVAGYNYYQVGLKLTAYF
jgi:tetratricopeptide (TPR) repeat protein